MTIVQSTALSLKYHCQNHSTDKCVYMYYNNVFDAHIETFLGVQVEKFRKDVSTIMLDRKGKGLDRTSAK